MLNARRSRPTAIVVVAPFVVGVVMFLSDVSQVQAQWPTPKLTALSPPGGQIGTVVEVAVQGSDLDGLSALQFSHPGIQAIAKTKPATAFTSEQIVPQRFLVTIDGSIPPGEYEVWGVGRFGISNPKRFQVGVRGELLEAGSHTTLDSAMPAPVNQTISGTCDANAKDFYRFSLAAGQRIVFVGDAQQIGSRAMLTLEVYDSLGRELERVRNERGGDPVGAFVAPSAMDVWIAVRDFVYRGGAEYFYRLHVYDGPRVTRIWPPVLSRQGSQAIELTGWNLTDTASQPAIDDTGEVTAPVIALEQSLTVNVDPQQFMEAGRLLEPSRQLTDPRLASLPFVDHTFQVETGPTNPVRLYLSDFPIVVEADDGEIAQVTLPVEYVGKFQNARDRDAVRFQAKQGDVIWIDVLSESLGCSTDPELHISKIVRDEQGNEKVEAIAVVDDSPNRNQQIGTDFDLSSDDPSYRFVVPSDGEYQVHVKDLFYGASDPRNFYRLQLGNRTPDFAAIARPVVARPPNPNTVIVSSLVLRRGQLVTLDITLDRRYGFEGPIEIVPGKLPEGVSHLPMVIPAGANSGTLTLYASLDAPMARGDLELVARGAYNDQTIEHPVLVGTAIWGTPNRAQVLPEFRLTERLPISVLDVETQPVAVLPGWQDDHPNLRATSRGQVFETSRGGTFDIPWVVERRNGFAEALKFNPVGMPGEFGLQPIDVAGDATTTNVSIQATNANLKAGWYRLELHADAKWKYQRDPQSLAAAQQEQQRLASLLDEHSKTAAACKAAFEKLQSEQNASPESLAKAQNDLNEADAQVKLLQELKAQADQAVQAATNANKEVDLVETIRSWPVTIHIVEAPFRFANDPTSATVEAHPGQTVALPVSLQRDYGFAGSVELIATLPDALKSANAAKLTLTSEQTTGGLQLMLPPDSPTGQFSITIQGTAKFNNLDVSGSQTIMLNITPSTDP